MIEEGLRGYLLPLVSTERMSPMGKRPQRSELPALTYQVIAGESHYSHEGASDREALIQIDAWAGDVDAALSLGAEVREALDGYRGVWGSIIVGSVFWTLELDDHDPDVGLYRRLGQVTIHYREPLGS